jgi:hypothetical protein
LTIENVNDRYVRLNGKLVPKQFLKEEHIPRWTTSGRVYRRRHCNTAMHARVYWCKVMPEFENYLAGKWLFTRKKDANNDGLYIRIKTGGTVVEREIDTSAVS